MNSDGDRPLWGMPIPHLHTDIINCKRKSIEIYALILMEMHIPKSGIGGFVIITNINTTTKTHIITYCQPLFQVIWSPELAYLTVVLADSVRREQLQSLNPPTQDFPSLEPTKQVDNIIIYFGQQIVLKVAGLTLTCPGDQSHDFYSRQVNI